MPAHKICHLGIARTFQIPRPFRKLSLLENVALAAYYGAGRRDPRAEARRRARGGARPGRAAVGRRDATGAGLGAAALKKLELARALATRPKLLLADESLGGLDHAEMEQAADMLARIRSRMGITIVWVEHIMGVLMRVSTASSCSITARRSSRAAGGGRARSTGHRGLSRQGGSERHAALADVSAGYGEFQALFGVSLEVRQGEAVAVIGPTAPARRR